VAQVRSVDEAARAARKKIQELLDGTITRLVETYGLYLLLAEVAINEREGMPLAAFLKSSKSIGAT
jgi:hypothetical protein